MLLVVVFVIPRLVVGAFEEGLVFFLLDHEVLEVDMPLATFFLLDKWIVNVVERFLFLIKFFELVFYLVQIHFIFNNVALSSF